MPDTTKAQLADSITVDSVVAALNDTLYNDNTAPQANSIYVVEPFNSEASDIYGLQSIKHTESYTTSEVGKGKSIYTLIRTSWLDIISLGLIVCFVIMLIFSRNYLLPLFELLFNTQKAHKQFEEDSQAYSYSGNLFFVPSIIVFSVYVLFAVNQLAVIPPDLNLFQSLLFILVIVGALIVLKQLLLRIVGFVSLSQKFISELLFNRQLVLIASTLLLFPVAILLPLYHDSSAHNILLYIGIFIIAVMFISIIIRSLMLFRLHRISLFLWLLYLCILEIAPYLALFVLFQ